MAKGNTSATEVAEVKKAPAKKATQQTELVLGRAAGKLEMGLKSLDEAKTALSELANQSTDLTLQIAQKEEQLEDLKVELEEGKRQNKVTLELDFMENRKKVVTETLADEGMLAINKEEYDTLKKAYDLLKSEFNTQVSKEVAAGVKAATANFDAAKSLYIAEQAAKEADNKAKVSNLEDKVSFLQDQVDSLLEQLKEAGDNAVKIAQAGSIQNVNLGTESKR